MARLGKSNLQGEPFPIRATTVITINSHGLCLVPLVYPLERQQTAVLVMHRCLAIPELLIAIVGHAHGGQLLNIALTCRMFTDPALDALWSNLGDIRRIIELLPCMFVSSNSVHRVCIVCISTLLTPFINSNILIGLFTVHPSTPFPRPMGALRVVRTARTLYITRT